MKDAPAFDFYPERWLVGTAAMSDSDQLAYLRLLCHQWMMDGLPDDIAVLSRLAGGPVSDAVLDKFPLDACAMHMECTSNAQALHKEIKRRNVRLEAIRQGQRERIQKAQEKGRRMAAGRWKKDSPDAYAMHKHSTSNAQAMHEDMHKTCLKNAHHSPLTLLDIDTPCTEAEAWQFARNLHQLPPWTEQAVTKWYSTRASSHWTKGGVNQFPITSKTWKEDLRSSHSWATQQTNAHNQKYSTGRSAVRNSSSLPAGLPSLNDTAENSRVS